jgi:hypothetical protein
LSCALYLRDVRKEKGKGKMMRALFRFIDLRHCTIIKATSAQPIDSVGGEGDNASLFQDIDSLLDLPYHPDASISQASVLQKTKPLWLMLEASLGSGLCPEKFQVAKPIPQMTAALPRLLLSFVNSCIMGQAIHVNHAILVRRRTYGEPAAKAI